MLSAKYIHINMDKNKRPKLYTLPDTLPALQHPQQVRSVLYRVQTGTPCPASGLVCRALCVVCLASGTACAAACDV